MPEADLQFRREAKPLLLGMRAEEPFLDGPGRSPLDVLKLLLSNLLISLAQSFSLVDGIRSACLNHDLRMGTGVAEGFGVSTRRREPQAKRRQDILRPLCLPLCLSLHQGASAEAVFGHVRRLFIFKYKTQILVKTLFGWVIYVKNLTRYECKKSSI